MEEAIRQSVERSKPVIGNGKTASYIPELAKVDNKLLAAAICDLRGNIADGGDLHQKFSIQSISKIVSLSLAIETLGLEVVQSKVGNKPTADPFNSIFRLELSSSHKPLNPLVNAGAMAVLSILSFKSSRECFEAVSALTAKLTASKSVSYNREIYLSEKSTGQRNRSLAYFLSSVKILDGDVEEVLDGYFRQCSIELDVRQLSILGATLAADGRNPISGEKVLKTETCRLVRSLMMTCGLYEGSGDFAIRVGIPAKSGVGGGIVAAVPGKYGVSVFGPALDECGNSIGGIAVLEQLSKQLKLRVL